MDDTDRVSMGQAVSRLRDKLQHLRQLQPAGTDDQTLEVLAFDMLHHHVVADAVLVHVIDVADVAMIERTRLAGGFEKLLDRVGIACEPLGQDLQRMAAAHLHMLGQIHSPRRRGGNLIEQLVLADDQAMIAVQELLSLPLGQRAVFNQLPGKLLGIVQPGGVVFNFGQCVGREQPALFRSRQEAHRRSPPA